MKYTVILYLLALTIVSCGAAFAETLDADGERELAIVKHIRDRGVVRQFHKLNVCPSTGNTSKVCPGYVVDHILPLACGGADAVENMQYQSIAAGKAKDRWEIRGDANHKPCSGAKE